MNRGYSASWTGRWHWRCNVKFLPSKGKVGLKVIKEVDGVLESIDSTSPDPCLNKEGETILLPVYKVAQ